MNNLIKVFTNGNSVTYHNYFQTPIFINDTLAVKFQHILDDNVKLFKCKLSNAIKEYEFQFQGTALIEDDIIDYKINSINIFYLTPIGIWEILYCENSDSDNTLFIKDTVEKFLNKISYQNKLSLKLQIPTDSNYIIFNSQTIINILNIIYMYSKYEKISVNNKNISIKILDQNNIIHDYFDLLNNNSNFIINNIYSISSKLEIENTNRYIQIIKLVNFSTTINYEKETLNLVLLSNMGNRIYIQEKIESFLNSLYSIKGSNDQIAFQMKHS